MVMKFIEKINCLIGLQRSVCSVIIRNIIFFFVNIIEKKSIGGMKLVEKGYYKEFS